EAVCGRGAYTVIDFNRPEIVYATCSMSTPGVYKYQGGWTQTSNGINSQDAPWTLWFPPLVMDPSHSGVLYYGIGRLYQTTDGASSWKPISPMWNSISSISVAPSDSNVVYVASYNGAFLTRNAGAGTGATWSQLSTSKPVNYVVVHPTDAKTA